MNKNIIYVIMALILLTSITAINTREFSRVDGVFNTVTANEVYATTVQADYIVGGNLYGTKLTLNTGAMNIQGNWLWNSFSSLGIVINDKLAINNLETGNQTGTPLCVDINNYLCKCGYCA